MKSEITASLQHFKIICRCAESHVFVHFHFSITHIDILPTLFVLQVSKITQFAVHFSNLCFWHRKEHNWTN